MKIIYCLLFVPCISAISVDVRYPQFFHQSLYDSAVEIREGKTTGSFIAFINLINDTNIIINEWILNTTNNDFKVQSNEMTYSLITTRILDRERKNFYNFSIYAQHLIPPFEKISKNIHIRILDINDCIPSFNQTIYYTTLIPKRSNFTIHAFDCDQPNTENSQISYSLSNYRDLFRINSTTGLIQCTKNVYINEHYEIIVVARDHGQPSLSSTTLVHIKLVSLKSSKIESLSLFNIKNNSKNKFLLAGVLSICFVFISLVICLVVCCINYKLQRQKKRNFHKEKNHFSSSSSSSTINSSNDYQQKFFYDVINNFPSTYYFPIKQQEKNKNNSNNNETSLDIPKSLSSTTSSPISATDIAIKVGSDDGCYCSSDMSSEQSNHILLLNPSSLTSISNSKLPSKHVRFNENNHNIDGVLKRFENLYGLQANTEHCASYV